MLGIIIILIVICTFVVIYMFLEAYKNRVVSLELFFDDFPESFKELRLFFISDIHKRKISSKIINEVTGKADFVIIGGDLTEKGVPFSRVSKNIEMLKKVAPVFFVWGNNEYEMDYRKLDAFLLDHDVKILDNTAMMFESELGEKCALIGLDSVTNRRDRLDLALQDVEVNSFKILISHDPKIVKKIKKTDEIRLVLSGHTHGGQIRLLNFGLYEKGGLQELEQTRLLISNGYGTTMLPLRLGAPAQTHLIIIKGS